jgi:hypothetical protein
MVPYDQAMQQILGQPHPVAQIPKALAAPNAGDAALPPAPAANGVQP